MSTSTIKSVEIRNFKSIKNSKSVKLGPLTTFIGYNGSGKSSLIEGLETFQSILVDDLDEAMQRFYGFEHIWNKHSRHQRKTKKDGTIYYENPMSFRVNGRLVSGVFQARLDVNAEEGINGVTIESETFKYSRGRTISRNAEGNVEDSESEVDSEIAAGESSAPASIRDFVESWQFLSLRPNGMGSPIPQRMTRGRMLLSSDGSNVAQYLWQIREQDPDAFEGIIETLQYVLPYSKDVQPSLSQEIQRTMYLQMVEGNFKVPGWLLSTGTLRILALLAVFRNPNPSPVIVIEEIENGLDPRTINLIVNEIQAFTEAGSGQVLLTTHSPYLLDKLPLKSIVLVERNNGETSFRRPADQDNVREWAKEFGPGKLYTMSRLA